MLIILSIVVKNKIMIVPYTENGNCYVLTNFAAANNPVFMDESEVNNFKQRVNEKISALCEILGFNFHADQYQIIVAIKNRETFISYYKEKMEDPEMEEWDIPASTYILSQEMANIQSGYAKWFNFRHGRFGGVFGRRYTKILIRDEQELKEWVKDINENKIIWNFKEFWSYVKNFLKRIKYLKKVSVGSGVLFSDGKKGVDSKGKRQRQKDPILTNFLLLSEFLLRGRYQARSEFGYI